MPQAIATNIVPAATPVYGGHKPSAAGLQAQLQRFQQQLSDCVNCASATTPQGKSDIQAIAARINQVKQSIAEIDNGQPAHFDAGPQVAVPATSTRALQSSVIDVYA